MTDYSPVDCGLHSAYELAIIRHQTLRLTWRDTDGESCTEKVMPKDLHTRNHEEFLVVSREGRNEEEIRLDRILHFEPA